MNIHHLAFVDLEESLSSLFLEQMECLDKDLAFMHDDICLVSKQGTLSNEWFKQR
jgi:hypothetical protein